ncbi:hypothetical protein HK405_010230, partial [Cladochytrium tenue]
TINPSSSVPTLAPPTSARKYTHATDLETSMVLGEGGFLCDLLLDSQVYRIISIAGATGATSNVMRSSLNNVNVRVLEKVLRRQLASVEGAPVLVSEGEFSGRERRYRYYPTSVRPASTEVSGLGSTPAGPFSVPVVSRRSRSVPKKVTPKPVNQIPRKRGRPRKFCSDACRSLGKPQTDPNTTSQIEAVESESDLAEDVSVREPSSGLAEDGARKRQNSSCESEVGHTPEPLEFIRTGDGLVEAGPTEEQMIYPSEPLGSASDLNVAQIPELAIQVHQQIAKPAGQDDHRLASGSTSGPTRDTGAHLDNDGVGMVLEIPNLNVTATEVNVPQPTPEPKKYLFPSKNAKVRQQHILELLDTQKIIEIDITFLRAYQAFTSVLSTTQVIHTIDKKTVMRTANSLASQGLLKILDVQLPHLNGSMSRKTLLLHKDLNPDDELVTRRVAELGQKQFLGRVHDRGIRLAPTEGLEVERLHDLKRRFQPGIASASDVTVSQPTEVSDFAGTGRSSTPANQMAENKPPSTRHQRHEGDTRSEVWNRTSSEFWMREATKYGYIRPKLLRIEALHEWLCKRARSASAMVPDQRPLTLSKFQTSV